jgi:hypothetical protein
MTVTSKALSILRVPQFRSSLGLLLLTPFSLDNSLFYSYICVYQFFFKKIKCHTLCKRAVESEINSIYVKKEYPFFFLSGQ